MNPNPTTRPKPAKMPARAAPLAEAKIGKPGKKKILIVDDDTGIRESMQKVLRAEGYEVVLAANGQEGIGKFDPEQIDLVLLDISLPDMSGWDVFGTVTSLNPFVPIIIITGKNEQHNLANMSGAGALVEKPVNVPQLLQKIGETLADPPETHLKRLVGRHNPLRHVMPDNS